MGLGVVAPLVAVLVMNLGRDPHVIGSPLVGRAAPDFALQPMGGGAPVTLASLRGQPVVLNFWATWCVPCFEEHPVLVGAARRLGEKVRFIGVIYEDSEEGVKSFLARQGSPTRRSSTPAAARRSRTGSSACRRRISSTPRAGSPRSTSGRSTSRRSRSSWPRPESPREAPRAARGRAAARRASRTRPGAGREAAIRRASSAGRKARRSHGEALLARTEDVAGLLRCPVCQGLSVADSPATMAVNMKAQVREMLAAGYDQEQILAYFEHSYGEFVRLQPPLRGVNWLVWLGTARSRSRPEASS